MITSLEPYLVYKENQSFLKIFFTLIHICFDSSQFKNIRFLNTFMKIAIATAQAKFELVENNLSYLLFPAAN